MRQYVGGHVNPFRDRVRDEDRDEGRNEDGDLNPSGDDLDGLARRVLALYDITPVAVNIVQAGDVKTVWKIEQGTGSRGDSAAKTTFFCLKRLRHEPEKARFAAGAQRYVSARGGPVPKLFPTRGGDDLALVDGQVFAFYEWVEGDPINMETSSGLRAALHGLARFHRASKGYVPGPDSRVSSKLGRWPHHFRSMRERLSEWKGQELPLGREYLDLFLREVDDFIALAAEAEERLASSRYAELVAAPEQGLCHQDFGHGNALATPQGVVILDLDGVTFDLPARDLRKIIMKRALARGCWSEDDIRDVLRFYDEINPLSPAEKEVLFIDLLYPHEFHDAAKNPFRKQKPAKVGDLRRVASLARAKTDLLRALIARERQVQMLG